MARNEKTFKVDKNKGKCVHVYEAGKNVHKCYLVSNDKNLMLHNFLVQIWNTTTKEMV
jgi:hypothetical protein